MRIERVILGAALALVLASSGCSGDTGPQGKAGPAGADGTPGTPGDPGPQGDAGPPAISAGTIAGAVKDASNNPIAGVSVVTDPASSPATSGADGTFTLANVPIGAYGVTATLAGYDPFTLPSVNVAAGATTNVSLVMQIAADAPGTISGTVTDHKAAPAGLAGVTVAVEGTAVTATTAADGSFTLTNVPPGPVFLSATAPSASYLDGETRDAVIVSPAATVSGVTIVLSARQSDAATYVGMENAGLGCKNCHGPLATDFKGSAHNRSLSDIAANRLINPVLAINRVIGANTYTHMWPEDANDIVDTKVKANSPTCDISVADCTVEVYLCQLAPGEYAMKFGGLATSCSDGNYLGKVDPPPAGTVPLVRIQTVYGGEGDRDLAMAPRPNMGVFKQRFQGNMADVQVAKAWTYASAADKARDSLTLPVQITQSGDGGPKFAGYHPTETKFPGESWTQRDRTFSHACAGCHNTGMTIGWSMENVQLFVPRDGKTTISEAAITSYAYKDQNITCEHCHGPGSEHASSGGGKGNAIINPKYITAEANRQLCGKCHAYDDGVNAEPAQDYGFEYAWNSNNASKIGNGDFVAGVYQLSDYIGNWGDIGTDEEALWDPAKTGGKIYGQAHRQQYTMLSYAKHTNNPYKKLTCTSCHDAHTLYRGSPTASAGADTYALASVEYKNNVLCLTCHAGQGPFANISKDNVTALHLAGGGTATKNGVAVPAPTADEIDAAKEVIAETVSEHMAEKAGMSDAAYNPLDDATPVGRCTSCHMPKVAKSGGYVTGKDWDGNEAIVEGDQASHVFDIVWPYEAVARSSGGPTPASASYGTSVVNGNTYYKFGYMPNSCGKCHAGARRASDLCLDPANCPLPPGL